MPERTCVVEDCDTPVPAPGGARGMCGKHYLRWKRHGDTSIVFPRGWRGPAEDRFWSKVSKDGPVPVRRPELGPCWVWTAAENDGYGVFYVAATPERPAHLTSAYRYAYELLVKPVPEGLDLDHVCRNHACVNPAHLEPVPHRINLLRGESPSAHHARKEACPKDHHPYDIVRKNGSRGCSTCDRERQRREYWDREPSGPLASCECGCGATFPQIGRNGRPRRFVRGHGRKNAA